MGGGAETIAGIVERAVVCGASTAGLVPAARLKTAPSCGDSPSLTWPENADAASVLVLGLVHPESKPHLDWWGGPGGTEGNRALDAVARKLVPWLKDELHAEARILPYHVGRGGVFLKDAAVLAGLGVIGANNLLVTPGFGPRIRLRAVYVGIESEERPSKEFEPCRKCDRPCLDACPQRAFEHGAYDRARCSIQMAHDEAHPVSTDGIQAVNMPARCVAYCRACETACPVGRP